MEQMFALIPGQIQDKHAIQKVIKCNEYTYQYGLTLSETQAKELIQTRNLALKSNGRVEFGGGIIDKLIKEFCDSPFITKYNYAETIDELIEIFYYYKNETLECIGDDELLSLMKEYFDNNCKGALELLQNRELDKLAHNIRFGVADYANVKDEKPVELFDEEEKNDE